ncbi:hypothetical protein [Clostridium oryzae]|uniref:Uncharacterized protein n=1 Tax=Clostridium oryzae TaxID=1450648 RepID=A0A1V4ITY8_9CLOT|nr:hypothetical protein [Clostridium oryzae]OPJ63255.1 hypothetical protein CLORY_13380 [Clostridium oryzae]
MLNCNYSDMMINCNEQCFKSNSYSSERVFNTWPYVYPYSQPIVKDKPIYDNKFGYNTNTLYNGVLPQPVFPEPVAASNLKITTVNIQDICL